jgi:hypothetical protein
MLSECAVKLPRNAVWLSRIENRWTVFPELNVVAGSRLSEVNPLVDLRNLA